MAADNDRLDRPDRVIILDADDPMREIRGDFVWAEEHARVVDEARRAAYADGFADGCASVATTGRVAHRLAILRRRLRLAFLLGLLLLCVLMLPVVFF